MKTADLPCKIEPVDIPDSKEGFQLLDMNGYSTGAGVVVV